MLHKEISPSRKNGFFYRFTRQLDLQLMVLPAIVFIFIFSYIPMYGVIMGFQNYDIFKGFSGSTWVGLKHFADFFSAPTFNAIIRNTLVISSLKLLIGFPAPILLALMLNEVTKVGFKRTVQTVSYLPHFLSWVIVASFMTTLFSAETGTVNYLLVSLGLIDKPINFLSQSKYFWGILIFTNVWKGVGFSSIIYLAALAGVDPGLYEAASIDGASKFRQIFSISIPCILPVIIIYFVLAIGNLLNAGFEDILQLGNSNAIRDVADVIDTYVYRVGLRSTPPRFSYATAVGLFKSVINIILLVGANQLARRSDSSLW